MEDTTKFPKLEIKQLNLTALLFAHSIVHNLNSGTRTYYALSAKMSHPRLPYKRNPRPVICTVELKYRTFNQARVTYLIKVVCRYAHYAWFPAEGSRIKVSVEKSTLKEAILLEGNLSDTGLFEFECLTEESQELWRNKLLEILEF